MKNFIFKPLFNLVVSITIVVLIMLAINANGQSFISVNPTQEQKESTIVFASTLRDLYGYDKYDNERTLDEVLHIYYDVKIEMLRPMLGDKQHIIEEKIRFKNQLITSFLQEVHGYGYNIPNPINVDPLNKYEFILDIPVCFNRYGYIIPRDKVKCKNTTYHHGHTVFDHSDMVEDE